VEMGAASFSSSSPSKSICEDSVERPHHRDEVGVRSRLHSVRCAKHRKSGRRTDDPDQQRAARAGRDVLRAGKLLLPSLSVLLHKPGESELHF
jgi:hypothetical protein